eukprot:5372601-Alexandrium_andersonii.AAC.1
MGPWLGDVCRDAPCRCLRVGLGSCLSARLGGLGPTGAELPASAHAALPAHPTTLRARLVADHVCSTYRSPRLAPSGRTLNCFLMRARCHSPLVLSLAEGCPCCELL